MKELNERQLYHTLKLSLETYKSGWYGKLHFYDHNITQSMIGYTTEEAKKKLQELEFKYKFNNLFKERE